MPFQTVDIPLGGLNTKPDDYLIDPPGLAVLKNGQFDDHGGIQPRKPFAEILDSASNTIADIRKIVPNGNELVAFSKDALWSYSEGDGLWTERANYLAVKVDEYSRFVTNGDQFDCDRIEKGGVTFYCWSEATPSGTASYIAALDTATGAVKLSPQTIRASATEARLVVTTNSVFLVYQVSTTLYVRAYDPSDLTSSETSTSLSAMVAYDVIQDPATPAQIIVVASRAGFGYNIINYSETPTASNNTNKARTADGAVSIAFDGQNGDRLCVTYSNGTAITSDILDAAFADVNVSVSTGTSSSATVNQIASAYDAANTCHLFWSAGETTGNTGFETEVNTVDNAGTAGTEGTLAKRVGIASRAFLHDGTVYVWVAFAAASQGDNVAQLQNSYLLYSAASLLAAKAVHTQAGGFSDTTGHLSGVQNTSGNVWAWCGGFRRIIPLGENQKGYDAESPQDVVFEFDSNEARRTARLGETFYISGGLISQYDGRGVYEVGFLVFPWDISAIPAGGGSNLNGTYNWKQTYFWQNAKGEIEHSTTTTRYAVAVTANSCQLIGANLHITAKKDGENHVANYWWRQVDAAAEGAPYFLVTSKDPASTGFNKYIENDPTAYSTTTLADDLSDANLVQQHPFPENGGRTLANLSPPSASIIEATQDRLLLAGVQGYPHRLTYSKLRASGEVASFNDYLSVDLPPNGGDITALGFLNETLIVFKERAIYLLPGDGFDNNGTGQNYGPARIVNSDVGAVSHESVALTPLGLIYKSQKGWHILDHGLQARYIGGPVSDFDADTIKAVHVMEAQHQVRILTSARILIWDWLVPAPGNMGAWSEWDLIDSESGVSACIFGGTYHYTDGTKVYSQRADWTAENGPVSQLEFAASAGASNFYANQAAYPNFGIWPVDGWALLDRGTANEELLGYTDMASDGQMYVAAEDSLTANDHAIGDSIEYTMRTLLAGSASAGASSLIVDATAAEYTEASEWPYTGRIIISEGLAAEEEVEYTANTATSFTLATALQNSHADNAVVRLMLAEPYGLDIEFGWVKLAGLQGYKLLRYLMILATYKGACRLRVRVAYNYDDTWIDDTTHDPTDKAIGDVLQIRHSTARRRVESFKLRLTVVGDYSAGSLPPSTEALSLSGVAVKFATKPGQPFAGLPAARKQ